jgi:hypothetical protein
MRFAVFVSLFLAGLVAGDELVLKDGKKIAWTSLRDLGDSVEVELPQGTKLTVPKSEIDKVVFGTPAAAPKPNAPEPAPAAPKAEADPGKALEIPNASAFSDAKKRVDKDYEEDYKAAKAGRAAKKALAGKLLTAAASADAAGRYVMLSEAMSLAAEGLDPATALTAVAELSKTFPVKKEDTRSKLFEKVRSSKKAGDSEREIADVYVQHAEKALLLDDHEQAIALAREAHHPKILSAPGLYAGLVHACQQLILEATEAQKEVERFRAAGAKLANAAEDPSANLDRGRYLCFFKADWAQGLPHLAKSGDRYAAAAAADHANPSEASGQLELAEAWLAIAQKEKEPYRRRVAGRAVHWYAQAWDALTPPQQAKVEKPVASAQDLAGKVNLFLVKNTVKNGGWNVSGKAIHSPGTGHNNVLELAYAPPPQFDLELLIQNPHCMMGIAVATPAQKFAVVLDGVKECAILLEKAGTGPKAPPKIFPDGKQSNVLIQVRPGSLTVSVEGATIMEWKGNAKDLSAPADWKLGTNALYLAHTQNFAGGGSYKVLSFTLIRR